MITGTVRDGRGLEVTGTAGTAIAPAVIDTCYTGIPSRPAALVSSLGLDFVSPGIATRADGSEHEYDVFRADINWFGRPRRLLMSATGNEAFVGMALLADCESRVEIRPGGAVEVKRLP